MLRTTNNIFLILIFLFGLILTTSDAVPVWAAGMDQMYYLNLQAPYTQIGGDFDGKLDSPKIYQLYELKESLGYGLAFGATREMYACEIGYSQSEHRILNLIPESEATLETLNISVKINPSSFIDKRCRPYALVGWGLSRFKVENGVIIGSIPFTAKYEGTGFHLGFGMNWRLGSRIAIDGSVAYYRYNMDKIKLFGYRGELPEGDEVLMANTIASLGVQYYF